MPCSGDGPTPATAEQKMLRLSSASKSAMPLLIQICVTFNWNKPQKCFGLACQMWSKNTTGMLSESEGSCRLYDVSVSSVMMYKFVMNNNTINQ
ncbi:hypothetical protein Lal_00036057 [Lupinus albus]|nr:hypothetical protein Lal_00036057 [Lupinus albus]